MRPRICGTSFLLLLLCSGVNQTKAATIAVTNTADNGAGSLRAALANAANGDTVDATGVSGKILLTSGELVISNNIRVIGPGPASLAIDGNFPNTTNRVLDVLESLTASISGLTITNGHSSEGGGIAVYQSTLTVSNCVIAGNSADSTGGGMLSFGGSSNSASLTVVDSILSGNSAAVGGGIYNWGEIGPATLVLVGCVLSNNSASTVGGGGIKNDGSPSGNATVSITNCTLSGNSTGGSGGAIQNDGFQGSANLTIADSTLSGNSANAQFAGGGLFNDGSSGGNAVVTLINTTLSGNSSVGNGGAIRNGGLGGGNSIITLLSSTISSNSGPIIGGILNIGHINIGNTILNGGGSGTNLATFSGTVTSLGYNICSDGGAGVLTNATDQISTDPFLGPLQDNGGPVFTHALLPGSPAIDQGKNLSRDATDARGFPRTIDDPAIPNAPGGDGTDIGAFEAFDLRITSAVKLGADLELSFTTLPGTNYELQSRPSLIVGSWSTIPGSVLSTGSIAQITLTNAFTEPQQFYRVHQLP